jgi:hypothetical protein
MHHEADAFAEERCPAVGIDAIETDSNGTGAGCEGEENNREGKNATRQGYPLTPTPLLDVERGGAHGAARA